MSKPIAILVIVGGVAAYLLLRSKAPAPSSPTIAPPVAPGHTTT